MTVIKKEKVFENTIEYFCNLWGKVFQIFYVDKIDLILIINDFKNECPKCKVEYNKPNHGDQIVCSSCFAQFEFYGAMHPQPIGETRKEVEKAMEF
jgi:protein-arginine kinase activator protein McsA